MLHAVFLTGLFGSAALGAEVVGTVIADTTIPLPTAVSYTGFDGANFIDLGNSSAILFNADVDTGISATLAFIGGFAQGTGINSLLTIAGQPLTEFGEPGIAMVLRNTSHAGLFEVATGSLQFSTTTGPFTQFSDRVVSALSGPGAPSGLYTWAAERTTGVKGIFSRAPMSTPGSFTTVVDTTMTAPSGGTFTSFEGFDVLLGPGIVWAYRWNSATSSGIGGAVQPPTGGINTFAVVEVGSPIANRNTLIGAVGPEVHFVQGIINPALIFAGTTSTGEAGLFLSPTAESMTNQVSLLVSTANAIPDGVGNFQSFEIALAHWVMTDPVAIYAVFVATGSGKRGIYAALTTSAGVGGPVRVLDLDDRLNGREVASFSVLADALRYPELVANGRHILVGQAT